MSEKTEGRFRPYANNSGVLTVGDAKDPDRMLVVENGVDQISIYGSLDLPKDQTGLERALILKRVLDGAISAILLSQREAIRSSGA